MLISRFLALEAKNTTSQEQWQRQIDELIEPIAAVAHAEGFNYKTLQQQLKIATEQATCRLLEIDTVLDVNAHFQGTAEQLNEIRQQRKACVAAVQQHICQLEQICSLVDKIASIVSSVDASTKMFPNHHA